MAVELTQVGKYEILRKIGHGGMGSVALALDTVLGRKVALKTMLPDHSNSEDALRRFRQEAKAVARLHHPNLVTLFDFGEAEGICFLAMEFVNGRDLEELFAHEAINPRQVGAVLALVLDGLEEAHLKGVLHRDVKPSNIRIFSDRGRLSAKLLDFGLAKISREGAITHSSTLVGTPYYMAPELLKGGYPDARTDLWSVAVILLQGLIGHRPFEAPTPAGIYFKIVFEADQLLLDEIPEEHKAFRAFVGKALGKDPAQRFTSAGAMAAALRDLLDLPVEGLPAPEWLHVPEAGPSSDQLTETLQPKDLPVPDPFLLTSGAEPRAPAPPLPVRLPEVAELHRRAEAGHAEAQNALGLRYLVGEGVFQNLLAADAFFRKAAAQGHAAAMVNLANLILRLGDPALVREAEGWLRQAADLGHIEAMSRLGCLLVEGGAATRLGEALPLLRKAAKGGFPEAAVGLVALAFRGQTDLEEDPEFGSWLAQADACELPEALVFSARRHRVEGRPEEALALLNKAWTLGVHEAAFECGLMHRDMGRFPEAKEWLAKANWRNHPGAALALARLVLEEGAQGAELNASQILRDPAASGDPEAMYLRGELLLRLPGAEFQAADARNLILQAAHLGHPRALLALARERLGGADHGPETLALLRQAAETGLPEAEFELGMLMAQGRTGAVNPRQARDLILKAAQAGLPEAMHAQWDLLVRSGQEPRYPAALAWLRRAAGAGHLQSMYQLGLLLAEGRGADPAEATRLLRHAAESGHKEAQQHLQRLPDRGERMGKVLDFLKSRFKR